MILFWATSVSHVILKWIYKISILCIHYWSIHFFLFLVTVCFYYGIWYSQGDTFPCIDGCNTCICLGNNNVGSTLIDCCKSRSYVYIANLCDTLRKSRYVLNIWNLHSYILCVFFVNCLFVCYSLYMYVCLCLFLLTCSDSHTFTCTYTFCGTTFLWNRKKVIWVHNFNVDYLHDFCFKGALCREPRDSGSCYAFYVR